MLNFSNIKEHISQQKFKEALLLLDEIEYNNITLSETKEINSFFAAIPHEIRNKDHIHITQKIYVCKMLGDNAGFEEWYKVLVTLRDGARDNSAEREDLENCICRVNVMRAKTNNAQTLILLSSLTSEGASGTKAVPCNATAKHPSVLRGNKDCSEWGKYYKAVRSILTPVLTALNNFDGKAALEFAVGELCLEKGDNSGALMSLGIAVNSDNIDIKYGANCVLAKFYLLEGDIKKAEETLQRAVSIVEDSGSYWLMPNLKAALANMAVSIGDNAAIEEWYNGVADLAQEKYLPDTEYINIIRAKALISKGEWREAALLLQGLTDYFDNLLRPLDAIECRILCALALMQLDSEDKAVETLHVALGMARSFGYTTVFADKGRLMFRLLGKYQKVYKLENGEAKFLAKVCAQTKKVSLILPAMFNDTEAFDDIGLAPPSLTDTEVRILQMIDEGASNKAIGIDLNIKLTTVKFHVKNIFDKFEVSGRVELLKKARTFKILN